MAVITDAEDRGLLKPGDTVVEATSGNTGIAVAMVCAQKAGPGRYFSALHGLPFNSETRVPGRCCSPHHRVPFTSGNER